MTIKVEAEAAAVVGLTDKEQGQKQERQQRP
jgi:hypothetical protein